MTKKEQKEKEKQEAIAYLRSIIKPSDTIIIFIKSVSASGMSHQMIIIADNKVISYYVAKACELPYINKGVGSVRVGGCGMDMTFWLADRLSYCLFNENGKIPEKIKKQFNGNGGTCLNWNAIY